MRKRTLLSMMALASVVSACGFKLRGALTFPFASLYIPAASGAPVARDVLRHLGALGGSLKLVFPPATPDQAEVQLQLLGERTERLVLAKTASGQAREVQLRLYLRFRLVGRDGREWIASTELGQQRDMTYNESLALAKEEEEASLNRDMRQDIAQQLIRRLSLAHPPAAE